MKNILKNLSKDLKQGCLVIDTHFSIIGLNDEYKRIHNLLDNSTIDKGTTLTCKSFLNYPPKFEFHLKSILDGSLEKFTSLLSHPHHHNRQYEISITSIKNDLNRVEAACIKVSDNITIPANFTLPDQSFFETLIVESADVYQLADNAFNIRYISKAVSEILGYAASEMIGKNVLDLVHPDDIDEVKDWLISIRQNTGKLFALEYRLKNKEGFWIWIENNARNLLAVENINAVLMQYRNVQSKKVADHALIQTEQRLSLLLNNTEESFIILNSRLRIVTYNSAAQEHSPYFLKQELQSGISILDLIDKEEADDYIAMFEKVFEGVQRDRETSFTDADSHRHIYNHTFRPLFDKGGDIFGVFITSRNITETKKLTEALAVNADRLKTSQKIAKLGYFEVDCTMKNVYCSEEFYEITGLTHAINNLEDLTIFEKICHHEDLKRVRKEFKWSVSRSKDFNIEFRIKVNDQQEKVILAIGGVSNKEASSAQKLRVTLQDITDSKMAIMALQTLESRFKSLFENSLDGVLLSKEDGSIISANPAICSMLGYSKKEIIALEKSALVSSEDEAIKRMREERRKTGAFVGEITLKHKMSYDVPAEITTISLTDAQGNTYLSSIIRDITEKKKIEMEQKALTEELLKNNQDLQQFSYITSHNLRAPVANLISLLNLYNKENPADDFNQLLIEKFEQATNQLNETLNDLLNVLVIKSNTNVQKEEVSFIDVFERVKKSVYNLLDQTYGKIRVDFSEVEKIEYNRIHLESIFLNLVSNAIRYSSPDRSPEIKIKSYRHDKWVVVEFEDNGLGMDLNRYGDRLFGLYQRFHENKEGKGLGLYMTKSQVIAAGGKVDVESILGKGTIFKIYFKS